MAAEQSMHLSNYSENLQRHRQEEFVGGEDQFVGGEGQFVGGEDQFVDGEGQFVGGEGQFVGGEDQFVGGEDQFVGGEGCGPEFGKSGKLLKTWYESIRTRVGKLQDGNPDLWGRFGFVHSLKIVEGHM